MKNLMNLQKHVAGTMLVELNRHNFHVDVVDGNIRFNMTQMAKPYGESKKPKEWLSTKKSEEYINFVSVGGKTPTADLVRVRQGGIPQLQGTWCYDYHIASRFAQWLDVKFAYEVDEMVMKILTSNAVYGEKFNGITPVIYNGKAYYNYLAVLRSLGRSTTSGSVYKRHRDNKKHFEKIYGRLFIDIEFCIKLRGEKLIQTGEIGRKLKPLKKSVGQLSLNFNMKGGVL